MTDHPSAEVGASADETETTRIYLDNISANTSLEEICNISENLLACRQYEIGIQFIEKWLSTYDQSGKLYLFAGMCLTYGENIEYEKAIHYYGLAREREKDLDWIDYHEGNLHLFVANLVRSQELFRRVKNSEVRKLADQGLQIIKMKIEKVEEAELASPSIDERLVRSVQKESPIKLCNNLIIVSPPKGGTHFIRNILSHFFAEAMHQQFVFDEDVIKVLNTANASDKKVYTSHMTFSPSTLGATERVARILLIREPISHLLSLTRAAFAHKSRKDFIFFQQNFSFEETMRFFVSGYSRFGHTIIPFQDFYFNYCVRWVNSSRLIVFTEELLNLAQRDINRIIPCITSILEEAGISWKKEYISRLSAGIDPLLSATYVRPFSPEDRATKHAAARSVLSREAPMVLEAYKDLFNRSRDCQIINPHRNI